MATEKKAPAKKTVAKKAVKRAPAKKKIARKQVVVRSVVTTTKKKLEKPIALSLAVNGDVFETETESIAEALAEIGKELPVFKTKLVITATFRDKKVERVLNIFAARRLFVNEMSRNLFEKGVKMALAYDAEQ